MTIHIYYTLFHIYLKVFHLKNISKKISNYHGLEFFFVNHMGLLKLLGKLKVKNNYRIFVHQHIFQIKYSQI